MRRSEIRLQLTEDLAMYERSKGALPGIMDDAARTAFVEQMIESVRRNDYYFRVRDREIDASSCDPLSRAFNPLRAAVRFARQGEFDEGMWMIFLSVHFGRHGKSKWLRVADVYGALGNGPWWTWDRVSGDIGGFRDWLASNKAALSAAGRGFGNHRKRESLGGWTANGTGAVVASYVEWVGPDGHSERISDITGSVAEPTERFEALYWAVRQGVWRFGRLAAFDYCNTIGRLGLADLVPGTACLSDSTGPTEGANLLLTGTARSTQAATREKELVGLQAALGVGFDVLEDSLCNWQKSPTQFTRFRG